MQKIETTLETLLEDLKACRQNGARFVTVNGLDTGEGLEVQWVFETDEGFVLYYTVVGYDTVVPSARSVIASAWLPESELFDLLGVRFEGAAPGAFLEPDAPKTPLRREA